MTRRSAHPERPWVLALVVGVFGYAHALLNPLTDDVPTGFDTGSLLSYVEPMRRTLFESGQILTWNSVAFDGRPLLGDAQTNVFYPFFLLPSLAFGVGWGARLAYVTSFLVAGFGMYFLVRVLGGRPSIAAWAGLLFVMSGALGARIHAGHVQKVFALPLVPLVLGCAILVGRSRDRRGMLLWASGAAVGTGFTMLAGDTYLPVFLAITAQLVALVTALSHLRPARLATLWPALASWLLVLVLTMAGRLLAAADSVIGSTRTVQEPFDGTQDWYWFIAHLVFPFFLYGPTLPGQPLPNIPFVGTVPGPGGENYGWWEYSVYVGIVPVALASLAVGMTIAALVRGRPGLLRGLQFASVAALVVPVVLGAFWLANGYSYSPIHWLFLALPPLQELKLPPRFLMLTAVAVIALAAVGLELAWRVTPTFGRMRRTGLSCVAVAALVDVFLLTHWIPTTNQPPFVPALRRALGELRASDSTPFVVGIGGSFTPDWSTVALEVASGGMRVGNQMTAFVPVSVLEHRRVTYPLRVRYFITYVPRADSLPDTWVPWIQEGDIQISKNEQAEGDAWILLNDDVRPVPLAALQAGPMQYVIDAESNSPGNVLIPADFFPGWSVSIDGALPLPAESVDGYVAAATPTGMHRYVFAFDAPWLGLSLALGAVSWAIAGVVLILCWRTYLRTIELLIEGSRSH